MAWLDPRHNYNLLFLLQVGYQSNLVDAATPQQFAPPMLLVPTA
jgi:hypothetical protein